MRLAWSVMSDRWTHTAAIMTTLVNAQKSKEADPLLIRDCHPMMIPSDAEDDPKDESGGLSLWQLHGIEPPPGD